MAKQKNRKTKLLSLPPPRTFQRSKDHFKDLKKAVKNNDVGVLVLGWTTPKDGGLTVSFSARNPREKMIASGLAARIQGLIQSNLDETAEYSHFQED